MLFDKSPESLEWFVPDSRISPPNLMSYDYVLDPLYKLKQQCPDVMWTNDALLVSTANPAEVYANYVPYDSYEIPLNVNLVSQRSGILRPKLADSFENILANIVDYCEVSICVTSNFVLHIYGGKKAVSYAQYKIFVILNHQYGYAIHKLDLPLSRQPLVAGHNRQNLLTIFQQTSVNVYMPPLIDSPDNVSVDEIYLAGDKVKLVIAEKLLRDVVIRRTDTLEKECVVSSFVRDTLLLNCGQDLEDIMLNHATFIQFSPIGAFDNFTVRVQGTTRKSINNTIEDIMKLCGSVYAVEFKAHLDHSLSAAVAACGVNIKLDNRGTVVYGMNQNIHQALNTLKLAGTESVDTAVLLEQPLELMDFILGKKQGKIMKVINGTGTDISVEKYHQYNFRLRLTGVRISNVIDALGLLEGELPAEKSLYIPEVYHKQIIGQGGLSVQQIMRKYNVYMRFVNATREKYPNALGDSRSDNVLIRCPAKNKAQFDSAAQELLQCVAQLAKSHHINNIVLTRNHRRLLLASHSNALRETEVNSGAAIKLPPLESSETQVVEISGQTQNSIHSAVDSMKQLLVYSDYEFRIPYTPRLAEIVGPQSLFGEQVVAPLFLAMGAEVQAFEKVQMMDDTAVYSQIVVSVNESNDGEYFDDISQVVTTYLRNYHLDIVDQGKLSADIRVENDTPLLTSSNQASNVVRAPGRNTFGLYSSPQSSEAKLSSQAPPRTDLPTVSIKSDAKITLPQYIPSDLPTRAPMAPMQWNRNYDNSTPIKKRTMENDDAERSIVGDTRRRAAIPKIKMTHFQR